MRIVWTEEAARNLEEVGEYVARHDRRASFRLVTRITAAVACLRRHPEMCRIGRVDGTRELVVTGTSYIVPYRVAGGACQILAVYHSAREGPGAFELP